MTNQEAFTKVAIHLLTQRKKSLRSGEYGDREVCAYRGADGLQCAIGCLIPDDEYDEIFEGVDIEGVEPNVPSLCGANVGLLFELQYTHDTVKPECWETELEDIANKWCLRWEVPDEVSLGYREALGITRIP